jgi:hypothetical protein
MSEANGSAIEDRFMMCVPRHLLTCATAGRATLLNEGVGQRFRGNVRNRTGGGNQLVRRTVPGLLCRTQSWVGAFRSGHSMLALI